MRVASDCAWLSSVSHLRAPINARIEDYIVICDSIKVERRELFMYSVIPTLNFLFRYLLNPHFEIFLIFSTFSISLTQLFLLLMLFQPINLQALYSYVLGLCPTCKQNFIHHGYDGNSAVRFSPPAFTVPLSENPPNSTLHFTNFNFTQTEK